MTFEERKVQSELRKRAKKERERGGKAMIKYQKNQNRGYLVEME